MWRPGKWVYAEEDSNQSSKNEIGDTIDENARSSLPLENPASPPWKLGGMVPVETAVFKDGRRMSKRFEKLAREREEKEKEREKLRPANLSQNQQQQPNQSSIPGRRERSKSIISGATATTTKSDNHQPTIKRPRKNSVANSQSNNTLSHQPSHHRVPLQKSSSVQPEPESENEPLFSSSKSRSSKPSPNPLRRPDHRPGPVLAEASTKAPNLLTGDGDENSTGCTPLSPKTSAGGVRPLAARVNKATPPKVYASNNEDLTHSVIETLSKTDSHLSDPHTPPAIGVQLDSFVSTASSPQLPVAPMKRFRPWEALKGIQTDGAEVAGDLKLIHEGHLRRQSKSTTTLPTPHHQSRKRDAAQSDSTNESGQPPTLTPLNTYFFPYCSRADAEHSGRVHSGHSSSDLTELTSSLSDLSDEGSDHASSSNSSIVYSESDIEDDCLPESLVRKVRRPSSATTNRSVTIKWKRKRSAAIHRARRAMRTISKDSASIDETGEMVPPPYIKIKTNQFPHRKPEVSDLPPSLCGCTQGGCGEKCENRAMFYLCDPKRCQLGQSCTNIPFNQRKDIIDESTSKLGKGLKVFYTGPERGWGLKTEIRLKKGMFLIDYRGEIISRENCYKRVINDYRGMKNFYFLDYDGSDVIDAGKKGNCSRFINHSCEPNLRVERFKISGLEEYQIGLFTLRNIEIGEELCYNYGWQNFSDIAPTSNIRTSMRVLTEDDCNSNSKDKEEKKNKGEDDDVNVPSVAATAPTVQKCYCGSKMCKGFLGIKRSGGNSNNHNNNNKGGGERSRSRKDEVRNGKGERRRSSAVKILMKDERNERRNSTGSLGIGIGIGTSRGNLGNVGSSSNSNSNSNNNINSSSNSGGNLGGSNKRIKLDHQSKRSRLKPIDIK